MTLARIGKIHGLRGEVKLEPLGRAGGALDRAGRVYVGPTQLDARRMEIEALRGAAGRPLLKLRGVDSPEEARALTGSRLFLPRRDFPPAAEGEYYWVDLVGLRVRADGEPLGVVEEILETPAFDLLVVRHPPGAAAPGASREERLIPFTASALREVRLEEGLILVHPPAAWEAAGGGPEEGAGRPGRSGGGEGKGAPGGRRRKQRRG